MLRTPDECAPVILAAPEQYSQAVIAKLIALPWTTILPPAVKV